VSLTHSLTHSWLVVGWSVGGCELRTVVRSLVRSFVRWFVVCRLFVRSFVRSFVVRRSSFVAVNVRRCSLFVVRCSLFVVRRSSFIVHRSSFIVRRSSFVVRRSSFVVHRSSFVVHRSSFIVHRSSFIVHRSSFIVRRSLFIVHRSSFIVHRSSFTVLCSSFVHCPLSVAAVRCCHSSFVAVVRRSLLVAVVNVRCVVCRRSLPFVARHCSLLTHRRVVVAVRRCSSSSSSLFVVVVVAVRRRLRRRWLMVFVALSWGSSFCVVIVMVTVAVATSSPCLFVYWPCLMRTTASRGCGRDTHRRFVLTTQTTQTYQYLASQSIAGRLFLLRLVWGAGPGCVFAVVVGGWPSIEALSRECKVVRPRSDRQRRSQGTSPKVHPTVCRRADGALSGVAASVARPTRGSSWRRLPPRRQHHDVG